MTRTNQPLLATFIREVTPLSGAPLIWSDTPVSSGPDPVGVAPILLSPDGTLIDAWAGGSGSSYATNILKNGKLVTAIPGVALGWIDNSRILVNEYALSSGGTVLQYTGATIYDSTGAKIATPALPELKSIQTVTSDSVYDPSHNAIYSLDDRSANLDGSVSRERAGCGRRIARGLRVGAPDRNGDLLVAPPNDSPDRGNPPKQSLDGALSFVSG